MTRKRWSPWADDMVRAVAAGDVAHDVGDGADAEEVDLAGLGDLEIALRKDADLALHAHGLLGRGDRALPAEGERDDRAREEDEVADRHDDERVGRQRRQCARRTALVIRGAEDHGLHHGVFAPAQELLRRRINRQPSAASRRTPS